MSKPLWVIIIGFLTSLGATIAYYHWRFLAKLFNKALPFLLILLVALPTVITVFSLAQRIKSDLPIIEESKPISVRLERSCPFDSVSHLLTSHPELNPKVKLRSVKSVIDGTKCYIGNTLIANVNVFNTLTLRPRNRRTVVLERFYILLYAGNSSDSDSESMYDAVDITGCMDKKSPQVVSGSSQEYTFRIPMPLVLFKDGSDGYFRNLWRGYLFGSIRYRFAADFKYINRNSWNITRIKEKNYHSFNLAHYLEEK